MIDHVMAMAMHRPDQILFEPMGMTVCGNYLGMLLKGLENCRHMRRSRSCSPENQRQTRQGKKHPSQSVQYLFTKAHDFACFFLSVRDILRLVRSSRGG